MLGVDKATSTEEKANILNQAWLNYLNVYSETKSLFSDYLEFIGALSFRDMGFQNEINSWSDTLILDLLKVTLSSERQHPSPTVSARPETLIRAFARIIGLHFAAWTLWTLPLASHELGHVLIGQEDPINDFVKRLPRINNPDEIEEFFADAFGTFAMGPAYACASVYLSLDPGSDLDIMRAFIIFEMLELMSKKAGKNVPYDIIITRLRADWKSLIQRYRGAGALIKDKENYLSSMVKEIWDALSMEKNLIGLATAQYPSNREDEGWKIALGWKTYYDSQKSSFDGLVVPKVYPTNKIRDILNAAWLVRLDDVAKNNMDNNAKIEEFARLLYKELQDVKLEAEIESSKRISNGAKFAKKGKKRKL